MKEVKKPNSSKTYMLILTGLKKELHLLRMNIFLFLPFAFW